METRYLAFAVPVFFLLIGVELWVARARGRRQLYRLSDAVTDLSCGMTSQLLAFFHGAALIAVYALLYQRYRLITFESAVWPWLLAFVGNDFIYYWWHRFSHEVNLLWAAHVVHHQSEDYNLAVALRQAVLTDFTSFPLHLPLALLGVPTVVYVSVHTFSTLYQFWIHTELIGKTPAPLGRVLNLPSHHRVHHAVNDRYLDKNYGAVTIVWDRLFGTFAEEIEAPVYGLKKPLASFNPIWAQLHYWFDLAQQAWRAPRLRDKARVWFASPSQSPSGLAPAGPAADRRKYDPPLSPARAWYVFAHFALAIVATFLLMLFSDRLPRATLAGLVALVLAALFSIGALVDGKRWAVPLEVGRLALSLALAAFWLRRAL